MIWRVVKTMSEYFRIQVWMKIELFGLTDVEVEVGGKKKKLNKARLMVEITGSLIKDPFSKWNRGFMKNFRSLRHLYDTYVIPGKIERLEDVIRDDIRDFKEEMKEFLISTGIREHS